MSGMTKLIHSGALPDLLDFRVTILDDPVRFIKAASIFGDYLDIPKPDKDHVGLHVVALGESERFGANRNGDLFPKKACIDYHDTFVKHGHVHRHHANRDAEKRLGQIVKSAYNERMGRIELFLHVNKEKAADELQKLARDNEIPVSMACRVAFDRCSLCNTLRKSASDPKMCDHIRYDLGKVAEDGRITGTFNDEPKFFDISFVYRPADRIAYSLKAASAGELDSITCAKEAGIWTPEEVAIDSHSGMEKLSLMKRLAHYEELYRQMAAGHNRAENLDLWELRKAAAAPTFSAETVNQLRQYEVSDVMRELARQQIVMDPPTFFKYALGADYPAAGAHMAGILAMLNGLYGRLLKEGRACEVCNDGYFDVDTSRTTFAPATQLARELLALRERASFSEKVASHRAVTATIDGTPAELMVVENDFGKIYDSPLANALSTKYSSYKLSALLAIKTMHPGEDVERQAAMLAAQNLINRTE